MVPQGPLTREAAPSPSRQARTRPQFYRPDKWAEVIIGVDPDPAKEDGIAAWARDYRTALHPHCAPGGYVNYMMEEGDDRIKATYRTNHAPLTTLKKKYDPANLFRVNQNLER